MGKLLITTTGDWTATMLRLTLGAVMLPHGAQKLLGWFGGYGFAGTMNFFTGMGVPAFIAFLIIVTEFFGGLALLLGVGSRLAALGIAALMVGAVGLVHASNGFFMNWVGNQPGEGFEFHLLALGIALAVMVKGSGALSLDRRIAKVVA